MDFRTNLADWSIEGVGGVLLLASLTHLVLDAGSPIIASVDVLLPVVIAGGVIAFGRWLHRHESFMFDARQRGVVALGQLVGGGLVGGVAGWIILIVGLEEGFPEEILKIILNGAALGVMAGGALTAFYLRLQHQQHALRTRSAQLQEQNARLERLASIVSHDLRNPLNVAQGRLEMAQETGTSDHFAPLERSLARIETIISDMLALTRQTRAIDEIAPTRLDSVAASAWDTVDTGTVDLQIEHSLVIECDENRLRQLFENLFRNAVEHGGDSLTTVRVGPLDSGGFYVEDDGRGIADSERETVFEWGMTTESSGTGLGLAIVHEIADAHGWTVRVTDSDGGGARFEFTDVESVR